MQFLHDDLHTVSLPEALTTEPPLEIFPIRVARVAIPEDVRRGRRAVDRLDAVVRASFRGDFMTLSAWRGAKRVHQMPGGVGSRAGQDVTEAAA